jgi:hypothetical protein
MKQFVRSVPAIVFASAASLSLIALAGCGSSGSSTVSGPMAAKSIYALQHTENGETEQDSVLVFSASETTTTTATPTSTLMLPSDFLSVSVAIGPTGTIYVGGINELTEDEDGLAGEILEYAAGSSGSATPTVTLTGSNLNASDTGTFTVPVNLAVNSAGTLFVSSVDGTLEAFASGFTASTPPTQYLTWGIQTNNTTTSGVNFGEPAGTIGADTAGDLFYMDEANAQIDVFAASATGPTAPERQITGTTTGTTINSFDELSFIAVDGAGDVYVTNYNPFNDPNVPAEPEEVRTNPGTFAANKSVQAMWPRSASRLTAHPHDSAPTFEPTGIIEFAAGATGNATPLKRIGGATATTNATNIVEPWGLAVDAASNLYYADAKGGYYSDANPSVLLEVFPSSATGNAMPAASISSSSFTFINVAPFFTTGVAIH